MAVHARAVIPEDRLGHEGSCFAMRLGNVADYILIVHNAVGHLGEGCVPHVDLALSSSAHLVMMDLGVNTYFLQLQDNFGANVLERVGRRNREISFLVPQLVPQIGAVLTARIPDPLIGVNKVVTTMSILV